MKTFQLFVAFLLCVNSCFAVPVATSHQSMVSGDGYRYSYGIVHGPPGIGHAVGESFPHGYGGFGTYAPTYGYEGYGLGHDLHHHSPALVSQVPVAPIPVVSKLIVPLPAVPLEPHPIITKPLEPHPVITKPLTIPFEDYVLSSPGHHYGYGEPHYGHEGHHYGYAGPHYGGYGVPHYGYGGPHYGEPHYGVTHLENSLYDHHYSSLFDHHDHHDDHLVYSSPVYGHGAYGLYKPSYHSYY